MVNHNKYLDNKSTKEQFLELPTVQKYVITILLFFIIWLENWLVMILFGTLHSFFNFVPAVGFFAVVFINIIFNIFLNTTRGLIRAL